MSDAEVLAANERFYAAFAGRDVDAMEATWAETSAVACLHPGWPPIRGRDEVLASFRSIFDNDDSPPIRCEAPTVTRHGDVAATVVCRERIGNAVLVATNVFVREGGDWRMSHHHASPIARVPPTPDMDSDLDPEALPN
jgi:ketosteroid isomerase-like protein